MVKPRFSKPMIGFRLPLSALIKYGGVAELVYAVDSKSASRVILIVGSSPTAPTQNNIIYSIWRLESV